MCYQCLTVTSAPLERVLSHPGELYSAKRANPGERIFAILIIMRMSSNLLWSELTLNLFWLNVILILSLV